MGTLALLLYEQTIVTDPGVVRLPVDPLTHHMTQGGDERIALDPETGLNRYRTAPHPHPGIAYASSTANFVSGPAMAALRRRFDHIEHDSEMSAPDYARRLDQIRSRLRQCWAVPAATEIIFAASGTDLEYVAIAAARRSANEPIDNLLLGADEVGSGCIYSAAAHHFAATTPLGTRVSPGQPLDASLTGAVSLIDIAIRCEAGKPRSGEALMAELTRIIGDSIGRGRRPLLHIVHGSKTGLVLPSLVDIDALRARYGDALGLVVDACQARISRAMVSAYLARGCTLFLTGSKFVGGPPFSGFALVPPRIVRAAEPLPISFASVFARAEWPARWRGRDQLPERANLGLLLRLEASLFELERFHLIPTAHFERIVTRFEAAVDHLVRRLGVTRLDDALGAPEPPTRELRTLATLDLRALNKGCDIECARLLNQALASAGTDEDGAPQLTIRLGQPVRALRLPDGRFGANLRIALSMPQICALAKMDDAALSAHLATDMDHIERRIKAFADRLP